jgi:hypothetical protein
MTLAPSLASQSCVSLCGQEAKVDSVPTQRTSSKEKVVGTGPNLEQQFNSLTLSRNPSCLHTTLAWGHC